MALPAPIHLENRRGEAQVLAGGWFARTVVGFECKMSANFKDKAGYLTKQGKTVKNWRRRWVVLKNNTLNYYKQKDVCCLFFFKLALVLIKIIQDVTPLDSIPLTECTCSFASFCETKRRCCLKINTQRRTWFFAADTDDEIGMWLEALFLWGVPESREEEDVITAILEATNALQAVATTVFQYSSAGPIDTFRDMCRVCLNNLCLSSFCVSPLLSYIYPIFFLY